MMAPEDACGGRDLSPSNALDIFRSWLLVKLQAGTWHQCGLLLGHDIKAGCYAERLAIAVG